MAKPQEYDVVIIGNGTGSAGAIHKFNEFLHVNPDSDLSVLVLESQTKQQLATQMPEYNARVDFPHELAQNIPDIDSTVINTYDKVAFYSHHGKILKNIPQGHQVSLVDVTKLIYDVLEANLHPNITVRHHKEVYRVEYVGEGSEERIKIEVQYPFGDEKVFEETDEVLAKVVIDGSGTGSVTLDCMQGYRRDSDIVCNVLAWKAVRLDDFDTDLTSETWDPHLVSLGLDDEMTHGAGVWDYRNDEVSPELGEYLKEWLTTTRNERIRKILAGRKVDDEFIASLRGRISDVGISSISTYAQAQHYQSILERLAAAAFTRLPGYKERFTGHAIIPESRLSKPSPVLQPVAKMAGKRYILVGDAAGQATPYIGEGVRPSIDMGIAAAKIILKALDDGNFSEERLKQSYEHMWWERYGRYDIWSDLFRHFSSTCFNDQNWDDFFNGIQKKLTDDEFYEVLKSQYTFNIVWKMFSVKKIAWPYLKYQARQLTHLGRKLTLRQADSWIK